MGEAIKKEKVMPRGTPACIKPKNSGMAEHEQNGVIMPSKEAKTLPVYWCWRERMERILAGGRKERITATTKIMAESKINIFIVS